MAAKIPPKFLQQLDGLFQEVQAALATPQAHEADLIYEGFSETSVLETEAGS